ncbi:hypothetical protein [Aquicella lusitana]|uniref:hypothetical protein n=1 Tax=Aquicella lusitana TaxID=254246 RepID=UPI002F969E78
MSCFIVDLKPENLLLKSSGELQLTDLGAATYYHNGPEQAPLSPSNFSDKGYLHPISLYEIAKQKRVPDLSRLVRDRLNDHFALALTILQLCHPDLQEFVVRRMIRNTRNFERRYEDADAHYQDVVSDYTNIIDELKKLDSFNKLHPDLAGFLLQLLNLDYHSIQPLNDMANGCQNYFAVGSEDEEEARQLFSRMLSSQANTKQPVQDKKLSLSSPVLLGGYVGTVAEETKVTSTALPIIQLGHKKEKLLQSEEDISEIKADPHSDLSQSRFTSTALIDKLSRIIHADNYWQAKSSASKNKKFMPALNEMKQILQALDDFQSENEILAALAKVVSTNKNHGVSAFNLFPSCAPLSPQKILFQAIKKLATDVHHQKSLIDLEMLHEAATGMEKNENLSGRRKVPNLQN